jgi:lipopolysaccharide export system permease protein
MLKVFQNRFNIKTIHLYIVKEFAASFLFGIAVFSVLLLLDRIFDLGSLFLSKGSSFFTIAKLFAFIYPSILPFAIPMSILFGVLLAFGRLSEDNEIIAMKANGMDYKTLTLPIIIPICIISFLLIFFNSFASPFMQSKVKGIFQDIVTQIPLSTFTPKTVIRLKGYTFYVNKVDADKNLLEGVSIYKFEDENYQASEDDPKPSMSNSNVSWRISASSATIKIYKNGIGMNLYGGFWQKANSKDLKNMVHATFNSYKFYISLVDQIENAPLNVNEMSSLQLLKTIKEMKKEKTAYSSFAIEFWTRFLFALAPIAFALLAIPIGIMSGKGGKAIGFGISLAVLVVYYGLLIIAMHVCEKNFIYTAYIMWLPNIFVSLIGIYLFTKMVKR